MGAYAPGGYQCNCAICKKQFGGDKRAVICLECSLSANHQYISELQSDLAAKETQIAGLLESNKEWGNKYKAVQEEVDDYLEVMNIVSDSLPENFTLVTLISKTLKKHISSPIDKDNG